MEKISASQAATLLGISIENLKVLEQRGIIHSTHSANGESLYSADEIPMYAVYDLGAKGFKIKLSRITPSNLDFSWIALAVTESAPPTTTPESTMEPEASSSAEPSIEPSI